LHIVHQLAYINTSALVLDTKSPKYLEMAQGHISLSVPFGKL
jgi:hypothetical protein